MKTRTAIVGNEDRLEVLARRLVERLAQRRTEEQGDDVGLVAVDEHEVMREQVRIGHWLAEELRCIAQDRLRTGLLPLDPSVERSLRDRVVAELSGAGPLEPYLHDPDVEEIDVNSHRSTWVSYTDGRKIDIGQLWSSEAELTEFQKRLARRMATTGEARLDTASPMATFQTSNGARVVMVLGGADQHGVSASPRLAIRRFVIRHCGLEGLCHRGLFEPELLGLLRAVVQTGFTVLISGPPGAGKTTLLIELLGEISPIERIVTVEKHLLELRLEEDPRHLDAPALFTRSANIEGVGEVSTRDLVELTRRLNPDRVVIGELVEDEALDMLDVASMCTRGSMATIHAHTPDVVLSRLAYYVAKSDTDLAEFAIWNLISQTVDFVIHIDLIRNTGQGPPQRRLTSILEVGGLVPGGAIETRQIWGIDEQGNRGWTAPLSGPSQRRMALAGHTPHSLMDRSQ